MLSYYAAAFYRSWMAAWSWATDQGIILTWSLSAGVLLIAVGFAVVRAFRKHHSWTDAVTNSGKALRDFFVFAVVASALVLSVLFVVFFVRDAPDQMTLATNTIDGLKREHQKTITELKATHESEISKLQAKIAELQFKLDDREAQRRERNEQIRLRNERINAIATFIAGANQIVKTFEEKDDKDLIRSQFLEWERGALEVLASSEFGISYLSQFGSARGTGVMLLNHNIEGNGWYSAVQGKLAVLNTFMMELRKQ